MSRSLKTYGSRIGVMLGILATMALFALPVSAEEIDSFSADITINSDSSFTITEEIMYDFEDAERHGIFRDIPVNYKTDVGSRRIFVDSISVSQDGQEAEISISRQSGNLRIRIGDPDVTITGEHTYRVSYRVRNALNFFDDGQAELYWDVVGTGWEVPIRSASASVHLTNTESVNVDDVTVRCFAGSVGSSDGCSDVSTTTAPLGLSATASDIAPGQAMTVVLNFPDTAVMKPTGLTSVWWLLQANPLALFPLLALIIGFYVWYRWGKDPKGRGVIVTQYEPPEDLKPILVGSLIDETVHMRDITAGIIYLAEQGFIEIEREDKKWLLGSHDYLLHKKRSFEEIDDITYRDLAQTLFSTESNKRILSLFTDTKADDSTEKDTLRLSDLKESKIFHESIKAIKNDVKQDMYNRGWFTETNSKASFVLWGIMLLAFFTFFVNGGQSGLVVFFGMAGTAAITTFFLILMKKKTKEGAILQEKLEGFKLFLSMTQKERLDFHNAPERKPKEFMEYLPYAIAFGVEEKWAKQFEGMDMSPPSWYHGAGAFSATSFASDLSSFSESYSQAASGASGASGGSAGGGMGGGGGGSW